MTKSPIRVLITGAAGQIAYSLIPLVAGGKMFGQDQPVILHLLDITPCMPALRGVEMEVVDCAYPLVEKVIGTDSPDVAFKDIDYALLVGSRPRGPGMERKELLELNGAIFKVQGKALNDHAKPNVKVLVVGNPANTNCLICMSYADKIPRKNFSALTRLDHNRAMAQIALRCNTTADKVQKATIWGNHSATQFPDVAHATVDGKPVYTAVNDKAYLEGEFITCIQKRGAAIIEARKLSSAMSAANAICDHMRSWVFGTPAGDWVSMAVCSDSNPYGVEKNLCYSFPVTCKNGDWEIVPGLSVSDFAREKMKLTETELMEERSHAL